MYVFEMNAGRSNRGPSVWDPLIFAYFFRGEKTVLYKGIEKLVKSGLGEKNCELHTKRWEVFQQFPLFFIIRQANECFVHNLQKKCIILRDCFMSMLYREKEYQINNKKFTLEKQKTFLFNVELCIFFFNSNPFKLSTSFMREIRFC